MARVNKTKPVVKVQLKDRDTKVQLAEGQTVFDPRSDSHVADGRSYKS
jgi:hypothetical protein